MSISVIERPRPNIKDLVIPEVAPNDPWPIIDPKSIYDPFVEGIQQILTGSQSHNPTSTSFALSLLIIDPEVKNKIELIIRKPTYSSCTSYALARFYWPEQLDSLSSDEIHALIQLAHKSGTQVNLENPKCLFALKIAFPQEEIILTDPEQKHISELNQIWQNALENPTHLSRSEYSYVESLALMRIFNPESFEKIEITNEIRSIMRNIKKRFIGSRLTWLPQYAGYLAIIQAKEIHFDDDGIHLVPPTLPIAHDHAPLPVMRNY